MFSTPACFLAPLGFHGFQFVPLLSFPLALAQTFPVSYFLLMKPCRVNVLPGLLVMWRDCSFSLSGTSAGLCHGHSGVARRAPEAETQQGWRKGCEFMMIVIVAGSQTVLSQPGHQVKLRGLRFNYMDEFPLNKLPERKALQKQYSHVAKVA